MLSLDEGKKAVKYARAVIENHVGGQNIQNFDFGENFYKKMGAFVTINTYPGKMLRGCVGIPGPVMPLEDAIKEAAVSATHDPRFPQLEEKELDSIVVEVTILTPPEIIAVDDASEYPKHIKIRRDGLIAERGIWRGLLLPQVPVEYGWSAEEFLAHTCMKAGLPPDAWQDETTKIYKFGGEVFSEIEPHGEIEKVKLENE
ncbi:MAG: TIGR00296 family protein [Candidatus Thermoplasmatota archaeon]|nr:TIGR00296 family protein [Candidatus Thermoplasmatota archaeon]